MLLAECAWLTGNWRGVWAVCQIVNMIGNTPRTCTYAQTRKWLPFYQPFPISLSKHSCMYLNFFTSLSFISLPTHGQLSSFSLHIYSPCDLIFHTHLYMHSVWLCGILLQVNNERRGVWPCQKCEKLTQRHQTEAETPPTLRALKCVRIIVCVYVCVSIPVFS